MKTKNQIILENETRPTNANTGKPSQQNLLKEVETMQEKNIITRLTDRLRGYTERPLNLTEFINRYQLDMILNNNLISTDGLYFELYTYSGQLDAEIKEIESDPEYYFTEEEIKEASENDELNALIEERAMDNIYKTKIYQWFIIPESDLEYWEEYTNYPIYKEYDKDIYLLGITHWGASWSFFETGATERIYY